MNTATEHASSGAPTTALAIAPHEQGLAVATHLSGLAGYIIPFGGLIVPIIIWLVKSDSPVISSIAKQALLLNLAVFVALCVGFLLFFTLILAPVAILLWILDGIIAVVLPIVGAIKASQGEYYRYPLVGTIPNQAPRGSY